MNRDQLLDFIKMAHKKDMEKSQTGPQEDQSNNASISKMGTTEDPGTKPCSKSGVTTVTEGKQAEDASRVMVTPGQGTEPPSKTVTTTMMEENQTKDASSVNVALEGHRTELSAKSVATIVTDTPVTDTREKEDQGTKSSLSTQKTIDVNELGRGWTKMQNMFTTRETLPVPPKNIAIPAYFSANDFTFRLDIDRNLHLTKKKFSCVACEMDENCTLGFRCAQLASLEEHSINKHNIDPLELELTSQHVQRWICCNCKLAFEDYEDQLQHRYLEHRENFCKHCKLFISTPFMCGVHEKDCLKYQKALHQPVGRNTKPVSTEQPVKTNTEPVSTEQPVKTNTEPVSTEQPVKTNTEPVSTEQPEPVSMQKPCK